jgi:hypothetical protein
MNIKEGIGCIVIVLLCLAVITFAFTYQPQQIRPVEEFTKDIQVKAVYPRVDAYLNHNPPYIVTTNGEIYDVDDSLLWAKFDIGSKYTIRYSIVKISGKTGTIRGIVEEK